MMYDHELMISDFYQGAVAVSPEMQKCLDDKTLGNCAVLALIKAALMEFQAIENIFKSLERSPEKVVCIFNDGTEVEVSAEDQEIVRQISGIKHPENSSYYEDAILLYAIICQRIFVLKDTYSSSCIQNFSHAVEYINSGYPTKKVHQLLALKKHYIRVKKLKSYKSAIIWSSAHASFCSYGTQDILGKKFKIGKMRWMKNPIGIGGFISKAYILKK